MRDTIGHVFLLHRNFDPGCGDAVLTPDDPCRGMVVCTVSATLAGHERIRHAANHNQNCHRR
jgi:hypothetical protein